MRTTNSKVMTIANRLVRQGVIRSLAMVKAWALVKLPQLITKISGVTFGNRKKALEHLARYEPERIQIYLERERDNPYDCSAVAVFAEVQGCGRAPVGYLPRALAKLIAPLIDAGKVVKGIFREVSGKYESFMNYGLLVEVQV